MSDIVLSDSRPLTLQDVKSHVMLIQQVMQGVMKSGTHYGRVPGCGDKPVLLKPGAEKIMATFRIAADPQVEDLSTPDEVRFRVLCRGISPGGVLIGTGVGECSSNEEKYKWKRATCDDEFEETSAERRREKWVGGKSPYRIKQIRTNPPDVANTVLKMAKKRALVDMVLTCTAASDCFEQDLEDMDDIPGREDAPPPVQAPRQRQPQQQSAPQQQQQPQDDSRPDLVSDPQRKRFYAIAKNAGKSDEGIKAYLSDVWGIASTKQITLDMYDQACEWAADTKNQ